MNKNTNFLRAILKSDMSLFNKIVTEIERYLEGPKLFNYSPIKTKKEIEWLIDYLEKNNIDLEGGKEEFQRINERFEKFRNTDKHYNKVYEELEIVAKGYCIYVNHLLSIIAEEFDNFLDKRDTVEILMNELEGKRDISEIKNKVQKADEDFKIQAKDVLNKFSGFYTDEWGYYPKSFWWRHLREFVEEQEKQKGARN